MMKRCSGCSQLKPVAAFARNRTRRDGLQNSCRDCQRAYVRRHYAANVEYYVQKARRRNPEAFALMRARIWEKKRVPCADCGVMYPPWVMTFDHVRGEKLFDIGTGIAKGWARILEEIAKCDVVCCNCHAERTQRRRMSQKPESA